MPIVPTFTAAQVRAAEAPLLEAGVPLMRRAAHALAQVLAEQHPMRVLVLAGAGDNGGDALFAAAEVAAAGTRVDVLRTSDRVHEEALAAAAAAGAVVVELEDADAAAYDLVVDGILGIGARGGLRGRHATSSRPCSLRGRTSSRSTCRAGSTPTRERPAMSCCRPRRP